MHPPSSLSAHISSLRPDVVITVVPWELHYKNAYTKSEISIRSMMRQESTSGPTPHIPKRQAHISSLHYSEPAVAPSKSTSVVTISHGGTFPSDIRNKGASSIELGYIQS